MVDLHEAQTHFQYIRWLDATRDLSPHTIRAYVNDISAFEQYLEDHSVAHEIDETTLLTFLDAQREAGLCPMSIRRRASAVRGYCRWLTSAGLLSADPWSGITLPAGRVKRLPRRLARHELRRLFAYLRKTAGVEASAQCDVVERPYATTTLLVVAMMVATGVRVGEAVGIECTDLDLNSRTLRILGKGRRERQVFLTNSWISALASEYLRARSVLGVAHSCLFFNRNLDPLTPAAVRARLLKAAERAGIAARLTPHMLRHTAATELIEAGVDIRYIQRLLGHASLTTTEIYTHVSDRALQRSLTKADVLGRCWSVDN